MFTVKQLKVGGFDSNFSYIVTEVKSQETVLIDPCGDIDIIKNALNAKNIPKYILLTHSHHDHISGVKKVQEFFNAPVVACFNSSYPIDKKLTDKEHLMLGDTYIECIHTPGHTDDSMVYRLADDSAIFTGDTLFIDYCGHCNAKTMFETLQKRIYPLKDSNIVYSGHDYGYVPYATLGEEKLTNKFLSARDFEAFKQALVEC